MFRQYVLVLLLGLALSTTSCVRGYVPVNTPILPGPINYTKVIEQWSQLRHPNEKFRMRVAIVREVVNERGPLGLMALQVHFFYENRAEAYILFIRNDHVLSWLYAGVPTEQVEEEDEEEEVFTAKDQA
jgi:hypothetical protein